MSAVLPIEALLVLGFVLGMILGSFLNVLSLRFHTGKSINGHSHCLSCQTRLRWFELVPFFSYVSLRGRCRHCRAAIPRRYFLMEVGTGLAVALTLWFTPVSVWWPLTIAIVLLLILIVVYDIDHMIIPNELVIILGLLSLAYLGQLWLMGLLTPLALLYHLLGGVLSAAFFYGLWWYSDGRWLGLGDAKLALPLGALVGLELIFSMIALAFWVGTLVSLTFLGYFTWRRRGQPHLRFLATPYTIKSEVPFAPFLIAGFALTFFGRIDVLTWFSYVWY